MENKVILITYADSLGNNLLDLNEIIEKYFSKAIGGIHILPFFHSSGDRGFSPLSYDKIDSKFGSWQDIEKISKKYELIFDFMINHISKESIYFKDFIKNKDNSKYKDLFIRYKDFWDNKEPTEEEICAIYKRKPKAPYVEIEFEDKSSEKIWCTFSEEQIDLNVKTEITKKFIKESLEFLIEKGANIIRLDAFAYAIKKAGTSCFFIEPETWELLDWCRGIVESKKASLLPEIHEHYSIHKKLSKKDYYTYDFALPMLMLHTIYSKNNNRLLEWLEICPRKQFTTLDTHDGIGVVDVADLMSQEEIETTKENLYKYGANVKRKYSSESYNNLDIYQINCTFYSALGDDDKKYLLSRAIQFFVPGIPQVYYVGMLSGKNDLDLLENTKEGRNINRHYYSKQEIEREMEREINKKLKNLMEYRNNSNVFDGEFTYIKIDNEKFKLCWEKDGYKSQLYVDLKDYSFRIE